MEKKVKLGIKVIPEFKDFIKELPHYQHEGDACFDLRVVIEPKEDAWGFEVEGSKILEADETFIFHTGLIFDIPEGYMLAVYPRSGLGIKHNIVLANGTGIIDSCYVDETRVGLVNLGKEPFKISNGDRVAQAMLVPVPVVEIEEVEEVEVKSRGLNSGLGSSGVQ